MTERPLVETARREALLCGLVFIAALLYTVPYCAAHGYGSTETTELKFVFGFPEWIFYGIIAPWGTCTLVAAIFSFFLMSDHEMDEAEPPASIDTVAGGSSPGADA